MIHEKPSDVVGVRLYGKVKIPYSAICGHDNNFSDMSEVYMARHITGLVANQIERAALNHVRWLFAAYLDFDHNIHDVSSAPEKYQEAVTKAIKLIEIESKITQASCLADLKPLVEEFVLAMPSSDLPKKKKIISTAINRMLNRIPTYGGFPPTKRQIKKALQQQPGVIISHNPLQIMIMSESGIHIVDRVMK